MKNKISILIADDHEVIRTGLSSIFEYEDDMHVVATAKNGEAALELAKAKHPDVIVMDLMMPVMDGATTTERLRTVSPKTRVLILTSYGTPEELARARAAGAAGILLKSTSNQEIVEAIRRLAQGETVISDEVAHLIASAPAKPDLTERQLGILQSVTRGLSNPDIALQYGISQGAVKKHLAIIFEKLGASTRAEATAIALKQRLLQP